MQSFPEIIQKKRCSESFFFSLLFLVSFSRHVAGLNAGRARSIAEWREKNGSFINREQLKLIKGMGPKSYQQCAGFIRINPQTLNRYLLLSGQYQNTNKALNKLIPDNFVNSWSKIGSLDTLLHNITKSHN